MPPPSSSMTKARLNIRVQESLPKGCRLRRGIRFLKDHNGITFIPLRQDQEASLNAQALRFFDAGSRQR